MQMAHWQRILVIRARKAARHYSNLFQTCGNFLKTGDVTKK